MLHFRSLSVIVAMCVLFAPPDSFAGIGDPNIPDLIYDYYTGEVYLDVDGSAIIGYSLKNSLNAFNAGAHTPILAGVSTSLSSELSEAALSSSSGMQSIGFVFPVGMYIGNLFSMLTTNEVSRGLGLPLVPFDVSAGIDLPGPPNPSFDSSLDTDTLDIDFGTVVAGSAAPPIDFEISNRETGAVGTHDLNLINIAGSGDTGVLSTDLALFSNLDAGTSLFFDALIDTSTPGLFAATYELSFAKSVSNESIPIDDTLTLNITGNVVASSVPEPSTYVLGAIGLLGLGFYGWRRRRAG